MTETTTPQHDQRPLPLDVIDGLVGAVPKLIERTRQQASLARSLAGMAPCLAFLSPRPVDVPAGDPKPERVDVLTVLGDDLPDLTLIEGDGAGVERSDIEGSDIERSDIDGAGLESASISGASTDVDEVSDPSASSVVTSLMAAPAEADLPVQDYDSLAASQVVPRLATLDTDELLAVQAYELAHRNRQTILNRVAQLLAG